MLQDHSFLYQLIKSSKLQGLLGLLHRNFEESEFIWNFCRMKTEEYQEEEF